MNRWEHAKAILILPFTVTIIIPALLLYGLGGRFRWSHGFSLPYFFLGLAFVSMGLRLMFATISMFNKIGKGTLAPWKPTQKLVVVGVYRHVRNPMISGVLFVLLGEAVASQSWAMLGWFLFFFIGNAIYIPLSEEPGLERRFGEDYRKYKANVPRWVPRWKAWEPEADTSVPNTKCLMSEKAEP